MIKTKNLLKHLFLKGKNKKFILLCMVICSGWVLSDPQAQYAGWEMQKNWTHVQLDKQKEAYKNVKNRLKSSEFKKELFKRYKEINEDFRNRVENGHFVQNAGVDLFFNSLLDFIAEHNAFVNPDELQVYLTYYTWPNAFCSGDGNIGVNIGLIQRVDDLEILLFVLCHELSHYYLRHTDTRLITKLKKTQSVSYQKEIDKIENTKYGKTSAIKKFVHKNLLHERQHQRGFEYQADSLGTVMFLNCGLSKKKVIKSLETINEFNSPLNFKYGIEDALQQKLSTKHADQEFIKSDIKYIDDVLLNSHPDCEKRIERVNQLQIEGNEKSIPKELLINFQSFRDSAKYELFDGYFRLRELDKAFLHGINYYISDTANSWNNHICLKSLSGLLRARKEHRLRYSSYYPNENQDSLTYQLSNYLYHTRLSQLSMSSVRPAVKWYKNSLRTQEDMYHLIIILAIANNEELQKEYSQKFKKNYPKSKVVFPYYVNTK